MLFFWEKKSKKQKNFVQEIIYVEGEIVLPEKIKMWVKVFFSYLLYMRNIKSKVCHFHFWFPSMKMLLFFLLCWQKKNVGIKGQNFMPKWGLFNGAVRKSPTTKIFQHLSLLITKITKVLFGIKNIPLWVHEITNPRLITYYNLQP